MSASSDGEESSMEGGIPLAEMIRTLRRELQAARVEGSDSELHFQIDKVDLELNVAITRTKKGDGGIEFWVIKAGGGYEKAAESTHTFTLSLTPVAVGSDGRFEVAAKTDAPVKED